MNKKYNFDICIPYFNSLPYLRLCVTGIRRNSEFKHNIIVHINGPDDEAAKWLKEMDVDFTQSDENLGFCAVNYALEKSTSDDVMIFNSDMYPFFFWDIEIAKQQRRFEESGIDKYSISSCLIEPNGGNPVYDIINLGETVEQFDYLKADAFYRDNKLKLGERQPTVQYCHPILMPRKMMEDFGYMDMDYFPGYGSDDDLAARAYYDAGCRNFVMLPKSRVYHFSSATFKTMPLSVRAKHGRNLFEQKWMLQMDSFKRMLKVSHPYTEVKER